MLNPNIQQVDIGLNDRVGFKPIRIKQYDKNLREIRFRIIEDGEIYSVPSNQIVKFQTTKPDGTVIFDDCQLDVNRTTIIYNPTEQLSTKDGKFFAELGFYKPSANADEYDGLIQTVSFEIIVSESAMDRNAVISSDEFNALTIMINRIEGVVSSAEESIEHINVAISNAETATNNANLAAENVNNVILNAENAISNANDAADNANIKATLADSATNSANTATSNAIATISEMNNLNATVSNQEAIRQTQESERQEFYNAYKVLDTYSSTVSYIVGNKVTYQGGSYQCIENNTDKAPSYNTDNTWWKCIAAKGDKGIGERGEQGIQGMQGKSYISKGNWDSNISYTNDTTTISTVLHNGSTYSCMESHISSISNQPPNSIYWQLMAQKGVDGLGSGDMTQATYDPQGKATDIFQYVDSKTIELPDNLVYFSEDEYESSPALPRDSDLLGGEPKSYYEQLVQDVADKVTAINNNFGVKTKTVACVVRYNGTAWECINDSGHKSIHVSSVITGDAGFFQVVYDFSAKNILSMSCTIDDSYALNGYQCGASVGLNMTSVYLSKPQIIDSVVLNTSGDYSFTTADVTSIQTVEREPALGGNYLRINHVAHKGIISILSQNKYDWKVLGKGLNYVNVQPYLNGVRQTLPLPNGDVAFALQKGTDIKKIPANDVPPAYSNIWVYGVFEVD